MRTSRAVASGASASPGRYRVGCARTDGSTFVPASLGPTSSDVCGLAARTGLGRGFQVPLTDTQIKAGTEVGESRGVKPFGWRSCLAIATVDKALDDLLPHSHDSLFQLSP